ncbi:spc7 kinetochore protein [Sarocladium implicatum]|nr:spc7 kinetochore protein [Sarocladium implicatum]
MAPSGDSTLSTNRRPRRSLGIQTASRKATDKENATIDVGSTLADSRKKSRSKSMGPGGLDALKQGSGNRRASLAVPTKVPRSILKPTISPLPEIPPLKNKSARSSGSSATDVSNMSSRSITDDTSGSKVALKTEEEQQAAARQREERERRDARRKSLANRRVSFAAEATLHTFHEIEFPQESTTSTDSTKRRSSVAGRESTPYAPAQSAESPENPRKRRRSSVVEPPQQESPQDDTITSTIYSSDSEAAEATEEIAVVEDDGNSSSDSDDGTMMSMDDATGTSIGSERSHVSQGESSTLDEALRLAARRAGSQRSGDDESHSDSDDGEEVIPSFGWIKKAPQAPQANGAGSVVDKTASAAEDEETEMDLSMDITQSVGNIINGKPPQVEMEEEEQDEDEDEEDMTMDVTQAVGGILASHTDPQEDEEPGDDATMDLTTAVGGIRRTRTSDFYESDGNEDMSMELTTAVGGLLAQRPRQSVGGARPSLLASEVNDEEDTGNMDMTIGVGRIVSAAVQQADEVDGDETLGMDMTAAIGGIIGPNQPSPRTLGKRVMEEEVDAPVGPEKAILAVVSKESSPKRRSLRSQSHDDENDERAAFQGKSLRRSTAAAAAPTITTTPPSRTSSPVRPRTPQRKSNSPTKTTTPRSAQRTPKTTTPKTTTPKTTTPKTTTPKTTTPKQQQQTKPVNPNGSSAKATSLHKALVFRNDPHTGSRTPTVVLTPQPRRLSGLGADRDGLGSPRVAALMDRRGSIGDAASEFIPGKRTVAFADPKQVAEEVDRERQLEEDRENGRTIMEREADNGDATLNLREMIDSLSPKRNPLKGRKSLAVGSALGLLGKRPMELDSDEEAEENDGVKRLKGHQASPVKNVRLQQPPSKAETAGRPMRSSRRSLEPAENATPSLSSPVKGGGATTPKHQLRFKDVDDDPTATQDMNFHRSPVKDLAQLERDAEEGQIHLQDFLNMTSIRFMELNTTKRRGTMAPKTLQDGSMDDGEDDMSLERCVVAGACTVPNLELYQHSCRELKKYISEGRRIVREIETDTFEENPPLFREYLSATPEVKSLMDNQFKNVKTHARLLSKNMWYEWRMKLQDGLKEGLVRIAEGMVEDEEALDKQETLLSSVLPTLSARYEALTQESSNLEEVARELADCDPAELQSTRDELATLDAEIERKKRLIAGLRQDFEESEATVQGLNQDKEQCQKDIRDSEKIREDCRGWTSTEVNALKERVDKLEKQHGWAVAGISGTVLSMTYKREIELVFDIRSFQPHQPNSQIEVYYIADGRRNDPVPITADKSFFVASIRDHVRALPQSRTKVPDLLRTVQQSWDQAKVVSAQIERIGLTFPIKVASQDGESSVDIVSSLLLVPLKSRVEVTLRLEPGNGAGVAISIAPQAKVLYGESFNVNKIKEFIGTRVGEIVGEKEESWSEVLVELHAKLLARGKKAE